MTVKRFVAAALIASICWTPAFARAQQQTAPDEAQLWHTMVTKLEPAALVAIRLKDGTRFKATILSAGDETFAAKPVTRIPIPAREIRYDEVASIERKSPSMSPAKKVLIGVGVGAGIYLVVVALLVAALGYD
jgi:hypothetical protein